MNNIKRNGNSTLSLLAALLVFLTTIILMPMYTLQPADAATDQQLQKRAAANGLRVVRAFYEWMNADWTASDQPYTKIRDDIDAAIASGESPEDMLRNVEANYPRSISPASVFALGYAGGLAERLLDNGTASYNDAIDQCNWASDQIFYQPNLYPHTFNFVRLAFVDCGNIGNGVLKNVGENLLKLHPHDQPVKDALIVVLSESGDRASLNYANKLAEERLASYPQDFGSYKRLAVVEFAEYVATHDVTYARAAISSYQHATLLAQSFPGNRADYADRIAFIQKFISK